MAEINAGQGVGLVREERSAGETVTILVGGAASLLARWGPESQSEETVT